MEETHVPLRRRWGRSEQRFRFRQRSVPLARPAEMIRFQGASMKFSHHAFIVSLFGVALGAAPATWAQDATPNAVPASSSKPADATAPAVPAQPVAQTSAQTNAQSPADPATTAAPVALTTPGAVQTIPGMPAVIDPKNIYSETVAGRISPAIKDDLARVYVPICAATAFRSSIRQRSRWWIRSRSAVARSMSCRAGICARSGSPTTPKAAMTQPDAHRSAHRQARYGRHGG